MRAFSLCVLSGEGENKNKSALLEKYSEEELAKLGVKERVRGIVMRQLAAQFEGDALKRAVRDNIDILIPKHIVVDDVFACVSCCRTSSVSASPVWNASSANV